MTWHRNPSSQGMPAMPAQASPLLAGRRWGVPARSGELAAAGSALFATSCFPAPDVKPVSGDGGGATTDAASEGPAAGRAQALANRFIAPKDTVHHGAFFMALPLPLSNGPAWRRFSDPTGESFIAFVGCPMTNPIRRVAPKRVPLPFVRSLGASVPLLRR